MSFMHRFLRPSYLWENRARVGSRALKAVRQGFGFIGVPLSRNAVQLRRLKDIHKGRRAFVLGNGPSLRVADLDRLKGEICFAANKIYLAFDETQWRPSYYFVADLLVARNNADMIHSLPLRKFYARGMSKYLNADSSTTWFEEDPGNSGHVDGNPAFPGMRSRSGDRVGYFSRNPLVAVYGGGTVIIPMLQIAHYMGISEVYIIGLDFSFKVPDRRVATGEAGGYGQALEAAGEVNHFHPNYRQVGEVWAIPRLDIQEFAFKGARAAFEDDGRRIFNASRQSKLEVFERANLDDVLSGR
jgi:hypothetical protein